MTSLNPEHVENLLNEASQVPWKHEDATTLSDDDLNLIDQKGHWYNEVDGDLAALAPQLAQDWLRMRQELGTWREFIESDLNMLPPEHYTDTAIFHMNAQIERITRILGEHQ